MSGSSRLHDETTFIYAFDLLELDGQDLRREPLTARKAALASVVIQAGAGLRLNEHIEADGTLVFGHACKLGLEGIVSSRPKLQFGSQRSLSAGALERAFGQSTARTRLAATDDLHASLRNFLSVL